MSCDRLDSEGSRAEDAYSGSSSYAIPTPYRHFSVTSGRNSNLHVTPISIMSLSICPFLLLEMFSYMQNQRSLKLLFYHIFKRCTLYGGISLKLTLYFSTIFSIFQGRSTCYLERSIYYLERSTNKLERLAYYLQRSSTRRIIRCARLILTRAFGVLSRSFDLTTSIW